MTCVAEGSAAVGRLRSSALQVPRIGTVLAVHVNQVALDLRAVVERVGVVGVGLLGLLGLAVRDDVVGAVGDGLAHVVLTQAGGRGSGGGMGGAG